MEDRKAESIEIRASGGGVLGPSVYQSPDGLFGLRTAKNLPITGYLHLCAHHHIPTSLNLEQHRE